MGETRNRINKEKNEIEIGKKEKEEGREKERR
jgi:hypothetical protein